MVIDFLSGLPKICAAFICYYMLITIMFSPDLPLESALARSGLTVFDSDYCLVVF
jgi:hypothetical protein